MPSKMPDRVDLSRCGPSVTGPLFMAIPQPSGGLYRVDIADTKS